ncbi:MAG TPA: DNA-binding response regulator, partial [Campylobacterales bacterium]|nr:DNA-binding response regulator [Campylobacterales bacterium]
WKDTSVKKRTINVNINRLLKKIDPRNTHNYFTPIRGIGYRFE